MPRRRGSGGHGRRDRLTDGRRGDLTSTILRAGDRVLVRLVKLDADDVAYPAAVVGDDGDHVVVRAAWAEAGPRDLGFVRFEPRDVFTEHYWRERWYSIKEVRDSGGSLKGWYCDVARPATVEPGLIVSKDLVLDLWRSPDGSILRLDEDEFTASGLEDADPVAAREARRAFDALADLAAHQWDAVIR